MFPQVVHLPTRTRFILSPVGVSLTSYPEFYFDGRSFTHGSEKIEVTGTIRHVATELQKHLDSSPTPGSLEALTAQVASAYDPSRDLDIQYDPLPKQPPTKK